MSYIDELNALKKNYQEVFSTPSGEQVLNDLKRLCFFKDTTFSSMENVTFINEGQRQVLLHILTMIDNKPFKEVKEDV